MTKPATPEQLERLALLYGFRLSEATYTGKPCWRIDFRSPPRGPDDYRYMLRIHPLETWLERCSCEWRRDGLV